jgi:hypothetical protein
MRILAITLTAFVLSACGEAPQRLASAAEPGYQTDSWPDQLRDRTLRQGESGRIYP